MGAFAHFAPGQFSTFFADIVQPAGHGRFHFAGEVASPYHAWVSGALDSAKRAVAEILRLDCPFLIPNYRDACGRSFVFGDDEKKSEEEFLSGLFSIELEESGF
jgi:Flavin containing amine oxidoreductase